MSYLSICILTLLFSFVLPTEAFGQRDFFTPEEVELIRENQEIDKRIDVLTHAIDRRFHVLKVDVSAPKIKTKGDWGNLPEGTRPQLFLDIRRILQKAVDDIDSLAERPQSAILPDPDSKKKQPTFEMLFPKAVRILASAAQRYEPALRGQLDVSTDNAETGSILGAIELCQEIIASVAKLPPETKKTKSN
jgi:hypothetical protein